MRHTKSEIRVVQLHPKVRDEVKALIEKAEAYLPKTVAIAVPQGLRTIDEQNALYAQGRTTPGAIVTNARGGSSYHNYGLAFDFCLVIDTNGDGIYDETSWDIKKDNDKDGTADWLEVVKVFEDVGWEWGGKWSSIKDYPHLQKTFGYTWQRLLDKYNKEDFIPGTKYVNV
jgi:peptidoglycan L-alanyl-D-glutamate endopeptidase CwlK